MKHFKLYIFALIIGYSLISCSGYGEKLQYDGTDVYYTEKVSKADAEKLGDFLVKNEFTDGKEKSVQLTKVDSTGNYAFRMVTSKEYQENDSYKLLFKVFAKQISDSVFNGKPVDFHVCDDTFKTLKAIPFE